MKRTPLIRRTPMKRGTSTLLRRSSKPRAQRKRTTYATRERNFDHMLWVKTLACVARDMPTPCGGVIEADHAGERGMSQKCPDEETIPICTNHHRERTDFSGSFKAWDKAQMREWLLACLKHTQELAIARSSSSTFRSSTFRVIWD